MMLSTPICLWLINLAQEDTAASKRLYDSARVSRSITILWCNMIHKFLINSVKTTEIKIESDQKIRKNAKVVVNIDQ